MLPGQIIDPFGAMVIKQLPQGGTRHAGGQLRRRRHQEAQTLPLPGRKAKALANGPGRRGPALGNSGQAAQGVAIRLRQAAEAKARRQHMLQHAGPRHQFQAGQRLRRGQ